MLKKVNKSRLDARTEAEPRQFIGPYREPHKTILYRKIDMHNLKSYSHTFFVDKEKLELMTEKRSDTH
jgi:hypothetical protein